MRRLLIRSLLVGAIGVVVGSSAGCAEQRPSINQVQPNAMSKEFFVGKDLVSTEDDPEFWAQGTVVDVGYGAAQDGLFTSTYAQPLSRIKWEITENWLFGRITYERINDSDGKKGSREGVIAYAYPIISHFDIQRAYNPTTGEELNTIVENGADRPWYERKYFRVDWSRNENTDSYDFDTLSMLGLFGGIDYEPLAYYINDPTHPHAPFFDVDNGYFDITNKAFAKPQMIDLSHLGWGIDKFPACYLDPDFSGGTAPSANCNPVELTLRQSFRRVVNNDYEPKEWDGYRFQSFGTFMVERQGYCRNYGMCDEKWHRMADRYQIWERAHFYANPETMEGPVECYTPTTTPYGCDPNRDGDADCDGVNEAPDGIIDECAAVGPGSICDNFSQKCTLPYQQRTAKPVVWFYTQESNQEYFEGTEWAAHEWDVALRSAVATAKYAECQRFGGQNCAQYPILTRQQDDNQDAIALAKEVDDCRHKLPDANGNPVHGGESCESIADSVGSARAYSQAVIDIAKMPEMLVLCHSPVQANDPEACAPAEERLPADATMDEWKATKAKFAGIDVMQVVAAAEAGRQVRRPSCEDFDGDGSEAECLLDVTDREVQMLQARSARMGDLRYHQVNVMTAPQTPSPWGIYTDAEDPLTGEKVSASINIWSHVNDLWSQGIVDTARYIKGELETDEITEGKYVDDWASAAQAASSRGTLGQMSKAAIQQRLKDVAGNAFPGQQVPKEKVQIPDNVRAKLRAMHDQIANVREEIGAPSTSTAKYAARLKALSGTEIEADLITAPMLQLAGSDKLPLTDPAVVAAVSPLQGANPMLNRELNRMKENALAERGACMMSADELMSTPPMAIADLADILEAKFGAFNPGDSPTAQYERAERMRKYLAQRAQYAVIIHEMGHSVSLRHNFVSSSDAYNFRSQYWQLRTKNGAIGNDAATTCTDLTTNGDGCVGPRYFDPMTDNEKKNLLWMFMHSSVMEYAGEATQDLLGLGAYDFAIARMVYGDAVAVYSDASYKSGADRGRGVLAKIDNFGGILGFAPRYPCGSAASGKPACNGAQTGSLVDVHYSQLQHLYSLIDPATCTTVDPNSYKPASWDDKKQGQFHPVLDGLIVSLDGGNTYSRCKQQATEFVQWDTLRFPNGDNEEGNYRAGPAVVDRSKIPNTAFADVVDSATRAPYGFATDRWADLGNLSVYRHDNGADPYELFDFLITQQEVGHIFDNYRRRRTSFSVRGASNRTLGRYNEKMRDGAKGLGLYANIYRDFALELGYNPVDLFDLAMTDFFPENALASGIAFDHFTRMMARPEPGPYTKFSFEPQYRPFGSTFSLDDSNPADVAMADLFIPNGATGKYRQVSPGGKPMANMLPDDQGEYSTDYVLNAGCYYDKIYTPMLMTESVDNFISDSLYDFKDSRYRAVSFADVFNDGFRRWLANNLTNDEEIKSVRIPAKANGDPELDATKMIAGPMGNTSWFPKNGPEVCFPNDESIVCSAYGKPDSSPFNPDAVANVALVDSNIGWEQQKFLIAYTFVFLPENQKRQWMDMLEIRELGMDSDPGWENRIEAHVPNGSVYVARTYGTETIFGKTVQKGIGARVLEWVNELIARGYECDFTIGADGTQWPVALLNPANGQPLVKYDSTVDHINPDGSLAPNGVPGCNPTENDACTCDANRACNDLQKYISVPWFLARMHGWIEVNKKGLFDL